MLDLAFIVALILPYEFEVVVENLLVPDGLGRPSLEVEKNRVLVLQDCHRREIRGSNYFVDKVLLRLVGPFHLDRLYFPDGILLGSFLQFQE